MKKMNTTNVENFNSQEKKNTLHSKEQTMRTD